LVVKRLLAVKKGLGRIVTISSNSMNRHPYGAKSQPRVETGNVEKSSAFARPNLMPFAALRSGGKPSFA
jgi:hypothetical protein